MRRARIVFELVLNQQMLTDQIELIGIETGAIRGLEALAKLNVEDLETQTAGGDAIILRFGEPQPVAAHLCMNSRSDRRQTQRWRQGWSKS